MNPRNPSPKDIVTQSSFERSLESVPLEYRSERSYQSDTLHPNQISSVSNPFSHGYMFSNVCIWLPRVNCQLCFSIWHRLLTSLIFN